MYSFSPFELSVNNFVNLTLNITKKNNAYLCFPINEAKLIAFPNRNVFCEISMELNLVAKLLSFLTRALMRSKNKSSWYKVTVALCP